MNPASVKIQAVPCPGCGEDKRRFVSRVLCSPVKVSTDLVRCLQCGLAYISPRPTREFEKEFYRGEYFELGDAGEWRDQRLDFFDQALDLLEPRAQEKQLFDVGCGAGYFLDLARNRGWKVQGSELSHKAVQIAREELKLEAFQGELKDMGLGMNRFSVMTLWNVLDQMYDPRDQLNHIWNLLKPGGILALRISNLSFHLSLHRIWRLFRFLGISKKESTVFHLQMFEPKTIRRLLALTGFTGIEIRNSRLDKKSGDLVANWGERGAGLIVSFCTFLFEAVRMLSLGQISLAPSILVFARKPLR